MESIYMYCALIGGTILVIQTILTTIGIGGADAELDGVDAADGDVSDFDGDHATSIFVQIFTFKSLVAFLTFFGLIGLAANRAEMESGPTLFVAVGAGIMSMFGVGYLMSALGRLQESGNIDLTDAVGKSGSVYLRIPGNNEGSGKIHLEFGGRSIEVKARTSGPELPTGAQAHVIGLLGSDTLDVSALEE